MKRLIFTLFMFTTFIASAQDTATIEQYCRLIVSESSMTIKVRIDVDMGEIRKLSLEDSLLRDRLTSKLKRFNSVVDVVNYMAVQGWSVVHFFPMGELPVYQFYFKKRSKRTELN